MTQSYKELLQGAMPEDLAREIDVWESQMQLRRQDKIDEKIFAETRLRRGVYGQRYDNGRRHDGVESKTLDFPSAELTKGPETMWDAPGMMRIKIPFGALTCEQMERLAEVAEEYSDAILHVTTRQDIQLHFVHIDDTPDLMRRLAAVGITTREACGNVTRNVTGCPIAGVCAEESFDISPYAHALTHYLLGHPDAQDFGRKFKVSFSGCQESACGLAGMHDLGYIAKVKTEHTADGPVQKRGFAFYTGGGLGAVPHQAKLFDEFLPEEEILPMALAVCRVFGRLGEKANRARARLKFLQAKLGFDEFKRLVLEERKILPADERWTSFLAEVSPFDEPLREAAALGDVALAGDEGADFDVWRATNVQNQRQENYRVVTLALPLGDFTSDQARGIADIARKYVGNAMRLTVEQNLVLRWVSEADLPAVYSELRALGLHAPGAGTIVDVTACPGTDTCKLGISSSRGLAGELSTRLAQKAMELDAAVQSMRIKVSGCFNACGQHHVSDLGFLGVSRKVSGYTVPHFQVVLGGQWTHNAAAFGLAIGAVPSKRVPEVVTRITEAFVKDRQGNESFQEYIRRVGKLHIRDSIEDLLVVPAYDEDTSFYSDWGDPREYTIGDLGVGECAGEVITPVAFGLQASERDVFEAQEKLDKDDVQSAADIAYKAMLGAARTLIKEVNRDLPDEPEAIVTEFRARLYDTKLFHDRYAGAKFAHYFFRAHDEADDEATYDAARQRIEEAQLFVEAAHACYDRMTEAGLTE